MKNRLFLLLSLFALTSCGTKVNQLGTFGLDKSGNWNDNYYTYFDSDLLKLKNEIITLDKETNKVFTSFADENFKALEEMARGDNASSYYYNDFYDDGFGPSMRLSKANSSVKEGVASKLFDGQMFCHGYYEAARVQINENGFSSSFNKKLISSDYLYLHLKSSLDFKSNKVEEHLADFTLNITFYDNEKAITYSYSLKQIPSNAGETYIFYGFSLEGLDLNHATSYSISYKLDRDQYNEEKGTNYKHALLLYEFGFKNPIFE